MIGIGEIVFNNAGRFQRSARIISVTGRIKINGHDYSIGICDPDAYCYFSDDVFKLSGSETS
ncbi:hypothetical protein [Maribellus sediminis]|uniref:hypothetical protein n=1 Tax=Maribellus sediminis TaxID=2696285 RepID=UPI00142FF089|nr:hypothetical protein [Maribellus sediminis]